MGQVGLVEMGTYRPGTRDKTSRKLFSKALKKILVTICHNGFSFNFWKQQKGHEYKTKTISLKRFEHAAERSIKPGDESQILMCK